MVVRVYNKVSGELGVSMNYKHPCSLLIVMTKKKLVHIFVYPMFLKTLPHVLISRICSTWIVHWTVSHSCLNLCASFYISPMCCHVLLNHIYILHHYYVWTVIIYICFALPSNIELILSMMVWFTLGMLFHAISFRYCIAKK